MQGGKDMDFGGGWGPRGNAGGFKRGGGGDRNRDRETDRWRNSSSQTGAFAHRHPGDGGKDGEKKRSLEESARITNCGRDWRAAIRTLNKQRSPDGTAPRPPRPPPVLSLPAWYAGRHLPLFLCVARRTRHTCPIPLLPPPPLSASVCLSMPRCASHWPVHSSPPGDCLTGVVFDDCRTSQVTATRQRSACAARCTRPTWKLWPRPSNSPASSDHNTSTALSGRGSVRHQSFAPQLSLVSVARGNGQMPCACSMIHRLHAETRSATMRRSTPVKRPESGRERWRCSGALMERADCSRTRKALGCACVPLWGASR